MDLFIFSEPAWTRMNDHGLANLRGSVILSSCNTDKSSLPDIAIHLKPKGRAASPRAEGVYIRETTSIHYVPLSYRSQTHVFNK